MKNCPIKTQNIKLKTQGGQALLIVLLGMAVILTLVLSIVARSVTDISITKKDEESMRAFSAAEAGVEKLLVGVGVSYGSGTFAESNSSYEAYISSVGNAAIYTLPGTYNSGEVATLWFVSHDANGNLTCSGGLPCVNPNPGTTSFKVCWKGAGNPAIEVSLYYDTTADRFTDFTDLRVVRSTFDSLPAGSRTPDNNFDTGNSGCNLASGYNYQTDVLYQQFTWFNLPANCNQTGCLLFARIKVFYAPAELIAGLSGAVFPSQGNKIESSGFSGDATRKVEAIQTFSAPLDIFENAVFSNSGNLTKP